MIKAFASFGRRVYTDSQWRGAVRKRFARKAFSTSPFVADFRDQGLVDSNDLTVFSTLHELQETSCKVYANNDLFGTYNDESGSFEYLTYREFGQKVDKCRAVLKHLGTWDAIKDTNKSLTISNDTNYRFC